MKHIRSTRGDYVLVKNRPIGARTLEIRQIVV